MQSESKPPEFYGKESVRLRLLAKQTTTPRIKERLLDLARDQERLAVQSEKGTKT